MSDSPRPAQVDHRVFEKAFEERQALRDKWPMLPMGILGNELYAQHCSILGGEPCFEEIWDVVDQATYVIVKHGEFEMSNIDLVEYYGPQQVQSYMWFAEMCCIIRCVGKGVYARLYDDVKIKGDTEAWWPDNLVRHAPHLIEGMCEDIAREEKDEQEKEKKEMSKPKAAGKAKAPIPLSLKKS